ncbi:hypothetical protein H0H92_012287 [Tricholoma furcatifolium]|nr:hypothetical protein H0H92_012287 [Tricholoma furcatifolium]
MPGADIVKDWIVNYFSPKPDHNKSASINDALRGASPVVITDRMPIILQHQGHSRTIVGYEINKTNKIKLLTFDPGMRIESGIQEIARALATEAISTSGQKRSKVSIPLPSAKRYRLSTDSVILIDGDDEIEMSVRPSPSPQRPQGKIKSIPEYSSKHLLKFLDRARLHTKGLGKLQYQILYFPMTQPLSEEDKNGKRTITSTKL